MKGFKNVRLYVRNRGIITADIGIEDGKIAYVGEDNPAIEEKVKTEDGIFVPGFIDEQIHGAGGADACRRGDDRVSRHDDDAEQRKYRERPRKRESGDAGG